MSQINRHARSITEFFEPFDIYKDRIFEMWEILDIFQYKVTQADLNKICEANQESARLRNGTVSYEYLFN